MTDQTPFHAGELEAQRRAGFRSEGAGIRDWMPDQHRTFFALLPFLPIATLDDEGWPVSTVLSGAPGFISSPDPRTLRIEALPHPVDPIAASMKPSAQAAVLGIMPENLRRNRANGVITAIDPNGLTLHVRQSFGNCPQYIQAREWKPAQRAAVPSIEWLDALDEEAETLVATADTFFVASSSGLRAGAPGGVDISHRGGRPGFVRQDGKVLTIPDFKGNRYFNTLGNFVLNPRASLMFVDWRLGTLLQLRGTVDVEWDGHEARELAGAERIWRLQVSGGWRIRNAVPLQWAFRAFAPTTERTGIWPQRAERAA